MNFNRPGGITISRYNIIINFCGKKLLYLNILCMHQLEHKEDKDEQSMVPDL